MNAVMTKNQALAIDRQHLAESKCLKTRPDSPCTPTRSRSSQPSISSAKSTPPLPSPSIVVARAYYLENASPIEDSMDALQRRRSLIEGQQFPRRHSVFSTPKILAVQLDNFSFSSETHDLQTVPEGDELARKVKIENSEDISMGEADNSEEVATPLPRQRSNLLCGTPQEVLRQVPFQYTHNHLRDWGYAYLGNSATADAFISAVSLRRPSMAIGIDDKFEVRTSTELVTIRARVVPKGKERKPFLIQRQFDIEDLRRSIPKVPNQAIGIASPTSSTLRRSSRARRSSTQQLLSPPRKFSSSPNPKTKTSSLGKGSLPIHIEYALHYLPVLGALMLSGHIRKGDSVDLPVPFPEAWRDVVAYIYTGKGGVTSSMKENIRFLAGRA